MPDVYNLTALMSSGDIGTLAQGTNQLLSGYWYGYFILFTVGVTVFIYLKSLRYLNRSCLAGTAWILFLTSIFLRAMSLLDNYVFWMMILIVPTLTFILALMDES